MRSRVLRAGVLVILLASGAGAAYIAWDAKRTASRLSVSETESQIERLMATVADIGSMHAAYVAPGQNAAPALERFPNLLRQLAAQTAEAGPGLRSADAQQSLRAVADATALLTQADASARDNLLLGDTVTASHILFGEARAALMTMTGALGEARRAERVRASAMLEAANSRTELVVGGVALVWIAGVLLLVPIPSTRAAHPEQVAPPDEVPFSTLSLVAPAPNPPITQSVDPPARTIDMLAAAEICAAIARVEDTGELSTLLGRAADLVGASELVVWLRGGDQLFASLVHGSQDDSKARLPLRRSDDSAAVRAWQSSHVEVASAAESADGVDVIAAPMVAPAGCGGVVTVSLRPHDVADEMTKAVVVMIAAQLSTVVAARPAPDASVTFATGT